MAQPLPRSYPCEQGVDPRGIVAFVDALEAAPLEVHSLMLLRHGKVVADGYWKPYSAERPHIMYSLSKSFASSAVGLAVGEGRLSLDDPVVSFFPDDLPEEISQNLAAMKVRDLLSMSCGHTEEVQCRDEENWVRAFLAHPVPKEPGTHFLYNSIATYMCSAIVQKVTGETVLDYLRPRLLDPIGIESANWDSCPRGINLGGWGLSITTDAIARFGQLYLQDGVWEGRRLLPEGWVAEATRKHVSNGDDPENDWNQGYGFQFWRSRHGAYRGDGAFGQFCIVMPEQDAVLAMTSGENNMGAILNLVWTHLLPAMGDSAQPLEGYSEKLANLVLPGVTPSVPGRKGIYAYERSEGEHPVTTIRIEFEPEVTNLSYVAKGREHCHRIGTNEWMLEDAGERTLASIGGWQDDDTYVIKSVDLGGPAGKTYTCRLEGENLTINISKKGVFDAGEAPPFVGKRVR